MIRYHLRLQQDVRYSFQLSAAPLAKDTLEQLIEGAIVHEIQNIGFGSQVDVELELKRTPDYEVLNSILVAVERCGYQLAEGAVVQWVDAQAQGALAGLVSGAGASAPTRNETLMVLCGLAGAFLGHLAGSQVRKHEVIYEIRRAYPGAPVELVAINEAKAPTITLADWLAPLQQA